MYQDTQFTKTWPQYPDNLNRNKNTQPRKILKDVSIPEKMRHSITRRRGFFSECNTLPKIAKVMKKDATHVLRRPSKNAGSECIYYTCVGNPRKSPVGRARTVSESRTTPAIISVRRRPYHTAPCIRIARMPRLSTSYNARAPTSAKSRRQKQWVVGEERTWLHWLVCVWAPSTLRPLLLSSSRMSAKRESVGNVEPLSVFIG